MELFEQGISVLVVAAHPDDETLGMGGTIRKMSESGCKIRVLFISDGVSSREIQKESLGERRENCRKALAILGVADVYFLDFPDNKLDSIPILELAKRIEEHVIGHLPKQVFTHFPSDLNVDHRAVAEATQIACRPKAGSLISGLYFFEVPSSTDWNFGERRFSPNLFVNIESTLHFKLAGLNEYGAEIEKFPNFRSADTLSFLARVRGSYVGFSAAEGFEIAYFRL